MKDYYVTLPISGRITVEVEAENENDALQKAFESEDLKICNVEEWEVHEHICEGNVCYAVQCDYNVEEVE